MYRTEYYLEITDDNIDEIREHLGEYFPEDEEELLLRVWYRVLKEEEDLLFELISIYWEDEDNNDYDMRDFIDEEEVINKIRSTHFEELLE